MGSCCNNTFCIEYQFLADSDVWQTDKQDLHTFMYYTRARWLGMECQTPKKRLLFGLCSSLLVSYYDQNVVVCYLLFGL